MGHWRILLVLCGLIFPLWAKPFDWRVVKRNGREYVTLDVFCESYNLAPPADWEAEKIKLQGAGRSVAFKRGSHEAQINGVRHWLSANAEAEGSTWLISRLDLVKLFDPILRPTQARNRSEVRGVVIDPGHGGNDQGAMGKYGMEKSFTLDTAMQLERYLKAAGIKTVLTRRTDFFVDLYERTAIAARYPGYLFVSLHYNSGQRNARGLETYCLAPRGSPSTTSENRLTRADFEAMRGNGTDELNVLLGSLVHRELMKLAATDDEFDRGVKRARFVVLRENVLPSILVEGGFVSNPPECRMLSNPDYRRKLARAVGEGIFDYMRAMGQTVVSPSESKAKPTPSPTPKTLGVISGTPVPSISPTPSGAKNSTTPTPSIAPKNSPTPTPKAKPSTAPHEPTKPLHTPTPTPTPAPQNGASKPTGTPAPSASPTGSTEQEVKPVTPTPTPKPKPKPKAKLVKKKPTPAKTVPPSPSLTPTPTPVPRSSLLLRPHEIPSAPEPAVREIPSHVPTSEPSLTPTPEATPVPATPTPTPSS